tara:strand:- start:1093 stop:1287 length:195 start_codon:yes stop_codon:yes gene_type:complete
MADQNKEQTQVALQILLNAASQARLTAAEHDQVKQAAQVAANALGLTDAPAPEIEMPDASENSD